MNYLAELKTFEKVEEIQSSIDTLRLRLSGHSGGNIKQVFENSFGSNFVIFEDLLRSQGINFDDPSKVRTFLDELEEQVNAAKHVELTLAYRPDDSAKGELINWLHKNVSEDLVLKLSYDPSIVAGARITYRGKYADYTSRKKLDDYFKEGSAHV